MTSVRPGAAPADTAVHLEWEGQADTAWRHASLVIVRSNGGVVEWVSPSIVQVLGYTPEDLVGVSLLDLTHADDHELVMASRASLAQMGTATHRGRLRHRDGSWRWIDVHAAVAREDDGSRTRAVSTWREVTREVQLVTALQESQRAFRLIAESASDVVVRGTTAGGLDWVSPSVTKMTGWHPDELIGRRFTSLVHPDDQHALEPVRDALVGTGAAQFEVRIATKAGGYLWVAVTAKEVEEAGQARTRIASWRNIDRKVAALTALAESNRMFQLLAENSSDVVLLLDGRGVITWASPSIERAAGWAPSDVLGERLASLVHSADVSPFVPDHEAHGPAGFPDRAVLLVRLRTRSGDHRWMSGTAALVPEAVAGQPALVVALHDVTDRVEAERALERDRSRLQATMSSLLDPHVLLVAVRDDDGVIVDFRYGDANEAAIAYLGITREQLLANSLLELLPGQAGSGMFSLYAAAVESGEPLVLDDYAYKHEILGSERRYDIRGVKVGDALSFTWRDVTDRSVTARALAASETRFRLLAENITDVVMHLRDGRIEWVSPSITSAFGWTPDELVGRTSDAFTHSDDLQILLAQRDALAREETVVFRLRGLAKDGGHHWIEVHGSPFIDVDGAHDGVIVSWRVVDEQVANEQDLTRRADHDELSGLLNRREALSRLQALIEGSADGHGAIAAVFCDLDNFKAVNDTLGHQVGDALIRAIATRLVDHVRPDDLVARLGGDEFLVVLTGVPDTPTAVAVADKLRVIVNEPIIIDDHILTTTVSLGLAIVRPGESVSELMARADHAMYKAKRAGRNRVSADDG